MSDRFISPPFARGELGTAYSDANTIDTAGNAQWEGKEWIFEDKDWSNPGLAPDRTNMFVTCRCVRNASGATLNTKRFVKFKADGTGYEYGAQVSGYGVVGDAGVVVDEFLTAAVPISALFWGVIEGPTLMVTDASGDTNIAIGNMVVPGSTADGTVVDQDKDGDSGDTAAVVVAFNQIQGAIGRAMTAVNGTGASLLVYKRRM